MDENIRKVTHVQNIRYDKAAERLYIIDQTLLPNEEREIELRTPEEMVEAIKKLRIRGAPAIGICAGYCLYRLAGISTQRIPRYFCGSSAWTQSFWARRGPRR